MKDHFYQMNCGKTMTNNLIIHLGTPCECLIATSIMRDKVFGHNYFEWIVANRDSAQILKYNKKVKNVHLYPKLPDNLFSQHFDCVINLHPDFNPLCCPTFDANKTIGFHYSNETDEWKSVLYGSKLSNKSIFQLYYRMSGLKWKGQGYDISYRPRSKSKKKTSGIAIANANLRHYVIEKLNLDQSKLWYIPHKKHIFAKMDEINKCPYIVTDDFFTLNIALCLKKNVYFLETLPFNTRLELFGSGKTFQVPKNIIQ